MASRENMKHFAWGCSVPLDPISRFPNVPVISHCPACECPGTDAEGVLMLILERACALHESNVVRYAVPVVNDMARRAAAGVGLVLPQGIDALPMYRGRVEWSEYGCTEVLGRGFTADELEELHKLPPGQAGCAWIL
ncbi:hypothetical protein GGR56DRAFT_636566 [Xylariaceae sp. FL0804]|nr:hypothetical protein GGR56DRAFT_636566 [Xylariaceae sp. FL0804]